MSPNRPTRRRRGAVDTSTLVAGVAGFKPGVVPTNASARLLRDWIDHDTFVWLMTPDILDEYTAVLRRLGVRPALIGRIVNLLREEAEWIDPARTVDADPDPGDSPFWTIAEEGTADFIVTLNPKDFPQTRLAARVIGPENPLPSAAEPKPRKRRTRTARR